MSDDADNKMALPPGTVLHGKYRVESVLGHGGFGITYYARDTSISREVAIKECLPADFAWREGTTVLPKATQYREDFEWARERFMDEARTLAKFDHPAIVKVYDIFDANGTSYMVTRYEPGWTLPEYLQAMGRTLNEAEARVFLHSLLEGLEQVHEAGYLHRDIKPENIYITERGQSLLLDFGSARQAVSNRSRPMTSVVTPGYAPFEQYQEDGNQGPWSDLYALAACIHYMLRGKPPSDATRRERNDPYEPLATVFQSDDQWNPSFLRAIDAALSVDETTRPQSADDFRDLLDAPVETAEEGQEREAEDEAALPNQANPQPPRPEPTPAPSSDAQKDSGLSKALLVLVIAGVLAILYFSNRDAQYETSLTDTTASPDSNKEQDDADNPTAQSSPRSPQPRAPTPQPSWVAQQPGSRTLSQKEQNQKWFEKANDFFENNQYIKAEEWFRKAAELGHAKAQLTLGMMYRQGKGVVQDDSKAEEWFRKAAELGYARAQNNLGLMYANGEGVPQDAYKAVEWHRKAAEQGLARAKFRLGVMYKSGDGVARDYSKAVKWFRKAAEQEYAMAQLKLGTMYDRGVGFQEDNVKAVELYRKASEQGLAEAQYRLSTMYRQGEGVSQDDAKAVEWTRKAAEEGAAIAQYNLGVMYRDGRGVWQEDANKAAEWFRKAAEQGHAVAQNRLGLMYFIGQGVQEDNTKAKKWYRKAAEQGLADAQNNLGWMYREGTGVVQDNTKAVEWFRKAAQQGHKKAQEALKELE